MNFSESGQTGSAGGESVSTGYAWCEIVEVDVTLPDGFNSIGLNGERILGVKVKHPDMAEPKLMTIESPLDENDKVLASFLADKPEEDRQKRVRGMIGGIISIFQAAGFPTKKAANGGIALVSDKVSWSDLVGKKVCLAWGGSMYDEAVAKNAVGRNDSAEIKKAKLRALPSSGFATPLHIGSSDADTKRLRTIISKGKQQNGWPLLGESTISLSSALVADPAKAQVLIDSGAVPEDNRRRPWFPNFAAFDKARKMGEGASVGGAALGAPQVVAPVVPAGNTNFDEV